MLRKTKEGMTMRIYQLSMKALPEDAVVETTPATGKTFIKMHISGVPYTLVGLTPPASHPDQFLFTKMVPHVQASKTDIYDEMRFQSSCRLRGYEPEEGDLIGVEEKKDGRWVPVFHHPRSFQTEPVIEEKGKYGSSLFFYEEGEWYDVTWPADRLLKLLNEESEREEEEGRDIPYPFFLAEGEKIPGSGYQHNGVGAVRLPKGIGFNTLYRPGGEGRTGRITVPRQAADGFVETFEHFCFLHERAFDDVRQRITITNQALVGRKLDAFAIGKRVKVTHPLPSQQPIEGFEGVVKNVSFTHSIIRVRFFDYFDAELSPTELSVLE